MSDDSQDRQHLYPLEDENVQEQLIVDPTPKNNDAYNHTMESFLRVTLAGFGGALVGMSLARTATISGTTAAAVGGVPVTAALRRATFPGGVAKRGRPHAAAATRMQELPAQWAVACLTFACIFETTRLLSPTSLVTTNKSYRTIGDYALGGCVAGSVLRGMPVSSSSSFAMAPSPRVGSGLMVGLVLGLIPGILVAGIDLLEDTLIEGQQQQKEKVDRAAAQQAVMVIPNISEDKQAKQNSQTIHTLDDLEKPSTKKGLLGLGYFGL